jgi:hypothetical protein
VSDYFRLDRYPSSIDAKRGDHFLQADLSGLGGIEFDGLFHDRRGTV